MDRTHPNWTATIPAYCLEVYENEAFEPGNAIAICPRSVQEHEWAVGSVMTKDEVIAVIPKAPYAVDVYSDPDADTLYVKRPDGSEVPEDWELVRHIDKETEQ